jgi:AraC-like DNA-binding protein
MLQRFPSLPVMLYTSLSPTAMKAVAELTAHGVRHVVLSRYDDEPARLLDVIERLPEHTLGDKVLARLEAPMALLPASLARALERLVHRPHLFGTVEAVAASAGVTVRTVYRHVESAGLASPRHLIVGARLLRAYSYLRDPGHSVEDIAEKLGYTESRIFARNAREVFDLTPTALRRSLTPDVFVDRLVAFLYPRAVSPPG